MKIEEEINNIKERNKRVELDKKATNLFNTT